MNRAIGAQVALWRTKMGKSRDDIAAALGMTASTVGLIERGILPISPSQLKRVSDYLHIPVDEFSARCD